MEREREADGGNIETLLLIHLPSTALTDDECVAVSKSIYEADEAFHTHTYTCRKDIIEAAEKLRKLLSLTAIYKLGKWGVKNQNRSKNRCTLM